MCGPLSAFACTRSGHRRASLGYQTGRLLGYGFAGLLAGQFGLVLADVLPASVGRSLFGLCSALALVGLALRVAPPWHRSSAARTPAHDLIAPQRLTLRSTRRSPLGQPISRLLPHSATALGALSALLPCGALLSALLLATGTGHATGGAVLMTAFALTSGPALLASSLVVALLARVQSPHLRWAAAITLAIAAVLIALPRLPAPSPGDGATHATAVAPSCH